MPMLDSFPMRSQQVLLFSVLLIVDSLHVIFARMLLPHIAPTTSAMYVLGIGMLEVGAFGLITRQLHWRSLIEHFWFYASIGFLVAASTMLSYESVGFIDPGTAAMLGKTSTLFSVAFGLFWLRERLTPIQLLGAALALAGAVVTAFQPGDLLRTGAILVLVSSFTYALHAALVKRTGARIPFVDFFFFRLLSTTTCLLLFAGMRGTLSWPDGATWLIIAVTGTVDVVISRTLYYLTLRQLPISLHSIILTLSPVASVLIALLIFQTRPNFQQLAGGALVLMGVFLVTRMRQK